MSEIYPTCISKDSPTLYYVEFERGDVPNEFTIFKRNFLYSPEEWKKVLANNPDMMLMTNEVHPYNMFTAEYGKDGCIPDKTWVKWMVDALNEKSR